MPETPTPEQILDSAIRDVEMAIHLMGHSGTDPMAWMDTARQSLVQLQALLDSHGRETPDLAELREFSNLQGRALENRNRELEAAQQECDSLRHQLETVERQLADPAHGRERDEIAPPIPGTLRHQNEALKHALADCKATNDALSAKLEAALASHGRPLDAEQGFTNPLIAYLRDLADGGAVLDAHKLRAAANAIERTYLEGRPRHAQGSIDEQEKP